MSTMFISFFVVTLIAAAAAIKSESILNGFLVAIIGFGTVYSYWA